MRSAPLAAAWAAGGRPGRSVRRADDRTVCSSILSTALVLTPQVVNQHNENESDLAFQEKIANTLSQKIDELLIPFRAAGGEKAIVLHKERSILLNIPPSHQNRNGIQS